MSRKYRKGAKLMKTLIYIEETVHRRLKYLGLDENLSMSEIIRRSVDEYLTKHYGRRRSSSHRKGGGRNA